MAARRTSQTVTLENGEDETEQERAERLAQEDFDETNDVEGGELFRITDEIRNTTGAKLMIVRTYPNTPDMAGHVGDLTPSEFSIERMRELFGPGRYRVRVVGPKGFLKGGGPVHIAKQNPAASGPQSSGASGVGEVAALLKALNEKDELRRKEESERRGRIMELTIPAAITGLTTMVAAIFSGNRGPDLTGLITALKPAPGPTITDLTTAVANIKTLTGGDKNETSQLETFLKIMELVKDHAGGDGKGETNWLDLARDALKEGLPAAKSFLETMQANQRAQPLPLPMQVTPRVVGAPGLQASPTNAGTPSVSTVTPAPTPTATPDGETDMMAFAMPIIREQLAKLLAWATENKNVELYSEVLLDQLPPIVHSYVKPQQALDALKRPDWFQFVTGIEPRLIPHQKWCDEMRLELIDIIEEQLREEGTNAPTPPQVTDPTNGDSGE